MVDVRCLDVLLRSLATFADLASCDLLVSCNSGDPTVRESLTNVCRSYPARSLSIDFFEPKETPGSQQHGEALNRLFSRTTSKHAAVFDPDVIVASPRWLDFCKRRVDEGCFIVGTSYEAWQLKWQGDFPNVWCAMIDGDALRAAKLDMRPWAAGGDPEKRDRSMSKDTSWRMAEYGLKNRLKYLPLSATHGKLSGLLSEWAATPRFARGQRDVETAALRMAQHVNDLHAMEFAYPGTDEVCCAHLFHANCWNNRGPSRVGRWITCANMVIDAVECKAQQPPAAQGP
jgi:hypothetical protein